MAKLTAGWTWAFCQLWLCWALMAPLLADNNRQEHKAQSICPMRYVTYGVGSDLHTFKKEFDICSQSQELTGHSIDRVIM
jgi:hypothetical protein